VMVEDTSVAIIMRSYSFNSFLEKGRTLKHQQHKLKFFLCILSSHLPSTGIQLLISRVCAHFKSMAASAVH
jgi:hypothetical protein